LRGRFHDQFEVPCGLVEMIEDDVMTKFVVIFGYEQMLNDAALKKLIVQCGLECM
jgi:hypothetical protein